MGRRIDSHKDYLEETEGITKEGKMKQVTIRLREDSGLFVLIEESDEQKDIIEDLSMEAAFEQGVQFIMDVYGKQERKNAPTLVECICKAIEQDVEGRKGLGDALAECDSAVRVEIIETWQKIIREQLDVEKDIDE